MESNREDEGNKSKEGGSKSKDEECNLEDGTWADHVSNLEDAKSNSEDEEAGCCRHSR
jgi:hypothetical protein